MTVCDEEHPQGIQLRIEEIEYSEPSYCMIIKFERNSKCKQHHFSVHIKALTCSLAGYFQSVMRDGEMIY